MPLIPKVTVESVDNIQGKSIIVKDATGSYDADSNPGGYGSPNRDAADVTWALLKFRNYSDEEYTTNRYNSLSDLQGTGQKVDGLKDGVFKDGVWELKYDIVLKYPVSDNTITNVTWSVGSRSFALSDADDVLEGAIGVIFWDLDESKIFYLDPDSPATSGQATVTETLPSAGAGNLAVVFEADARFMVTAAADNCLAKDTNRVVKECSCFNDDFAQLFLRMGKRQGADIFFAQENYQAAHDIIDQLAGYCDNTSNCGCA